MHANIEAIVDHLRLALKAPGMIICLPVTVERTLSYLNGIYTACRLSGAHYSVETDQKVLAENGYERRADGALSQMRERGLTESEIVLLLIQFEINKWQCYLASDK